MNKTLIFAVVLLLLSGVITGCKGTVTTDTETPGEVVKTFVCSCAEGNFDKIKETLTEDVREEFSAAYPSEADLKSDPAWQEWSSGFQSVEIKEEVISDDGETATVYYTVYYSDGTKYDETVHLVKEGGRWKMKASSL